MLVFEYHYHYQVLLLTGSRLPHHISVRCPWSGYKWSSEPRDSNATQPTHCCESHSLTVPQIFLGQFLTIHIHKTTGNFFTMPNLEVPESGLSFDSVSERSSKSTTQDIIGLTLTDDLIEEMIQCVQNGKPIQLSLGSRPVRRSCTIVVVGLKERGEVIVAIVTKWTIVLREISQTQFTTI